MAGWQVQFQKATQYHQKGKLQQAEKGYRQVLRQQPGHPDALHLLGLICSTNGRHKEAIKLLQQAVQQQPHTPSFANNHAEALRKAGKPKKAVAEFRRALSLQNTFPQAWYNLGVALKQLGQYSEAVTAYEQALQQKPDYYSAAYNLGNCFLAMNAYVSARRAYERALRIRPDSVELLTNMGSALQQLEEFDQAEHHYQRVLQLAPENHDAHVNLASIAQTSGNIARARDYLEQLVNKGGDTLRLRITMTLLFPHVAQSNRQIDSYRERVATELPVFSEELRLYGGRDLSEVCVEPPISWAYQGRETLSLKRQLAALYQPLVPALEAPGSGDDRLRVGFVVTHGHEGVFIKCMRGTLNCMDDGRFQVAVVCSPGGDQIIGPQLINPRVNFLVLDKELPQAVEALKQARFDLLYYWEVGTDLTNYLLPFHRLAPVQCAGWGWPTTTGIDNVDYFISSDYIEPEDGDDHYSEQLERLQSLPYYYRPPIPEGEAQRSDYGLPEQGAIYLCTQNLRKIHPDFDELAAGILATDPTGQVAIIGSKHVFENDELKNRLKDAMPDRVERLHFLERMEEPRYLALLKVATVVLDTPHYGGGANTCYDTLAAGTPLVTLAGSFHSGRYALGVCRKLELEELVADTSEDYADIAVRLGTDSNYRREICRKIQERAPVLFENVEAVRQLEAFMLRVCNK
ncbi:MAG: tetratricopeptide repeat protein [Halieaceae bacterium]|nr:tetratricopeptide repeat protein [Halieaceae bacterium]